MSDVPVALTNAQDGVPGVGTPVLAKHLNNLEAKVGVDNSAVPTSLDYLLKNPASDNPGHTHVAIATQYIPHSLATAKNDFLVATGIEDCTACWNLVGNLNDLSGNGHTLSWLPSGSPTYVAGLLPGNTAVTLDGSTQCFTIASHTDFNFGTGDYTIEAILKMDTWTGGYGSIFSKRTIGTYAGLDFFLSTDIPSLAHGTTNYAAGLSLTDKTQFHYVAVSVDRDGMATFCLDGVMATISVAGTSGLDLSTATEVRIGCLTFDTNPAYAFFKGTIDLVRVTKGRAMPAAEMLNNYHQFKNGLSNWFVKKTLAEVKTILGI